MKSNFLILIGILIFQPETGYSQSVKDETIEYTYTKLPLNPLSKALVNYTSVVFATYEAENAAKKEQYEIDLKKAEDDYQAEMTAYPEKVQAAEDKYAAEMEEYNKQGLAEKVIEDKVLGENNKPVKRLPPQPYKRSVPDPVLKTSYDYPVIADTYINLGGFTKSPMDAVAIKVTIYGFDYTQPRQMTTQKEITSYANGQTTKRMVTYYYTEFSYRHPMAVQVTLPDGTVILNETPQELNTYTIYKSPESETSAAINTELLIKTHEEKVFQSNLTFLNNLVNDRFGFQKVVRISKLYFVKAKDELYQDLLVAFNDASAALKLLANDESAAKVKLESSIQAWNTALATFDPAIKKARIDKDVAVAICFNLLECYFALRKTTEMDGIIAKLNTMNLSAEERKQKEGFEALNADLKKRLAANSN